MKRFYLCLSFLFVFFLTGILMAGPVFAEKPPWAGGGSEKGKNKHKEERYDWKGDNQGKESHKGKGQERKEWKGEDRGPHNQQGPEVRGHRYFTEDQRVFIHNYYADRYREGHCPPGLAKKHNGCMPPGQAKKWAIGRPLPRDVIFYDLPQSVLVKLGPPPSHHRFVRVAQDILLLAVGTGMVVDAIDNLNWEFNH